MAGKSFPRFERGLRLELNDMIHAAETSVLETIGQLIDEFIIGYDYSGNMGRNYIVRGFTVSNTSGTLLAINNGVALCQYRHRGAIKSAVHLSGGDPQKVIDVGGLSNGTYYVYVRFDLLENQFQNRLALDPLASPAPAERVRNVPTRRTESWSVTFADGSPGDEWTQVATFVMSGGAITSVTDTRTLYFEGAPSGGAYPLVPTTDWGAANDRNNSRGTYGVQGLRKFVRAVQQQLETLQGDGKKWWQTPTKALTDKLNRDGTNTITGNIIPDGDGTRDFGSVGARFQDIYTLTLEATDIVASDDVTVGDDLTVVDDASVGGDLTVAGTVTNFAVARASGYVVTDGAGGYSTEEYYRCTSVISDDDTNGDYITVTFDTALPDANYVVLLEEAGLPRTRQALNKSTTGFIIRDYRVKHSSVAGSDVYGIVETTSGYHETASFKVGWVVFSFT